MARISFGPKKLVPVEGSSGLPGLVRYKLSSRDPSPVHETSAVRVLCCCFFFIFYLSIRRSLKKENETNSMKT